MFWGVSGRLLFPSPCRKHKEVPPDIYSEQPEDLLEVNSTLLRGPHVWLLVKVLTQGCSHCSCSNSCYRVLPWCWFLRSFCCELLCWAYLSGPLSSPVVRIPGEVLIFHLFSFLFSVRVQWWLLSSLHAEAEEIEQKTDTVILGRDHADQRGDLYGHRVSHLSCGYGYWDSKVEACGGWAWMPCKISLVWRWTLYGTV